MIEGKEVTGTKLVYPDVAEEAMAAWRVERDEYMRQRDEWIAMEVFHEYEKRGEHFDIAVCIYPTAPFVTSEKLEKALQILQESQAEQA